MSESILVEHWVYLMVALMVDCLEDLMVGLKELQTVDY